MTARARPTSGPLRAIASKGLLGWTLLAVAIVVCFWSVLDEANRVTGQDLFGYSPLVLDWRHNSAAVARLLAGTSLYAPAQLTGPYPDYRAVMVGFLYPPPSVLAFAPFVNYPIGLFGWIVLNVGLLVTGLVAVLRRELGSLPPVALALVLFGLAVQAQFTEGVVVANLNVALAGVLAWSWALGRDWRGLGVVAGLAGIVKVVPGVMAAWAVRNQGWRPIVQAAVVTGVLSLATLPIFGVGSWLDFGRSLTNVEPSCGGIPAVSCMFTPFVPVAVARILALVVTLALVLGAAAIRDAYIAFASMTASWLAPLPDIHTHYLLVLYVLLVVGAARVVGMRRGLGTDPSGEP